MNAHSGSPEPFETGEPQTVARSAVQPGEMYSVLLFNDAVNVQEYVVACLMRVFGHPAELACKIMLEADRAGKALAEVEEESFARRHCRQLQSFGLTATVEKAIS